MTCSNGLTVPISPNARQTCTYSSSSSNQQLSKHLFQSLVMRMSVYFDSAVTFRGRCHLGLGLVFRSWPRVGLCSSADMRSIIHLCKPSLYASYFLNASRCPSKVPLKPVPDVDRLEEAVPNRSTCSGSLQRQIEGRAVGHSSAV